MQYAKRPKNREIDAEIYCKSDMRRPLLAANTLIGRSLPPGKTHAQYNAADTASSGMMAAITA